MKLQIQNQLGDQEIVMKTNQSFPFTINPHEFADLQFQKYKELLHKQSTSSQDSTSADSEKPVMNKIAP